MVGIEAPPPGPSSAPGQRVLAGSASTPWILSIPRPRAPVVEQRSPPRRCWRNSSGWGLPWCRSLEYWYRLARVLRFYKGQMPLLWVRCFQFYWKSAARRGLVGSSFLTVLTSFKFGALSSLVYNGCGGVRDASGFRGILQWQVAVTAR